MICYSLYSLYLFNFIKILYESILFQKENKKGQVELSLCLSKGEKDEDSGGQLILSLNRLRCSLQTMHEHEGLKGQMYLKMSVVDNGHVTHFWKSDRFAPTVSTKFSPETARVVADNPYKGALNDVSFVVKFVSKNKMGKYNKNFTVIRRDTNYERTILLHNYIYVFF